MSVDQDRIMGELVGGSHRPARTFGTGRVCAHPGCIVVLSMYNSRDCCSAHDFDPDLIHFRVPVQPTPDAVIVDHRRGHVRTARAA